MDRKEYQRQWYAKRKAKFVPAMSGEMMCKKCCMVKDITEYGTHPNMANGRRTTCKQCRSKETLKWFKNGGKNLRTKEKKRKYKATQIERHPEKYAARNAVMNAIKAGKLVAAEACERCGSRGLLHGHHPDYKKMLDVEWLCVPCHTKEHLIKE